MTPPISSSNPTKFCAVYCRVSSDEGLGQEFNSIDAQQEAGQAFIASQRSEGWVSVSGSYEDGGYSGGNMERPALKRLLADIALGKITIVVVYKIDRLTRSLADFSKMVEIFENHGVSFVSVTQQFNTTTSMGRLTLNILLSFAQFEREMTGERIRDKIAASKKKGIWMGGTPPLGYDVIDRRLVINEKEAAIVRRIFKEMLRIGSPTAIAAQLNAEGITTKAWTTQTGKAHVGQRIDRKYIDTLLRNRLYLGEISHKGQWYPAEHHAVIASKLWDDVHATLSTLKRSRTPVGPSHTEALLRGLLFNVDGEPMYPTYTRKKERIYRYYISKSVYKFGASIAHRDARVPAEEIEAAVLAQIHRVLSSPESISAVLLRCQQMHPPIDEATVVVALRHIEAIWQQLFPAERSRIVSLMVGRIDLLCEDARYAIRITWHPLGWRSLIDELTPQRMGAKQMESAA